ncbi:MAG TPA: prephenate dehydrogenase [Phycisphaerae bacterium]|nr:prephenate dehydrogenase [Phycisphaerae bacterium]HRY69404.1 prephenate dehydrogenase [Phycisphaerae bacterium]HSA26271.1 prephenate dehydrogenase [Phycisphaerae bacterium]
MHKIRSINTLDRIAILGVGLLGGSIGLALQAHGFTGTRVGIGRRQSSLKKALEYDAVDEVTCDVAAGVAGAQLVILCTPIGRFEGLLRELASALSAGACVTDVGSTKGEVVRLAERLLPRRVGFVGSHPMAGSEKTGVEYARADLFDEALCLVTPTRRTPSASVRFMLGFWQRIGARTMVVSPARHDMLLARVSHLPHAVAAALVRLAMAQGAIDVAGPGFADTTRIAGGDPAMWTDIFRSNRRSVLKAVDLLVGELRRFRSLLDKDDPKAIDRWLARSQHARQAWIGRRYNKKG